MAKKKKSNHLLIIGSAAVGIPMKGNVNGWLSLRVIDLLEEFVVCVGCMFWCAYGGYHQMPL